MSFEIRLRIPEGLLRAPQLLEEGVKRGVERSTGLVTKAAAMRAPRKTGNLKRSIGSRPVESAGGSFLGKVVQDKTVAKYGSFVEYGTGIYGPRHAPIYPTTYPFLAWKSNGRFYRKKYVNGMRPRPFMRTAFKASKPLIERKMNEELSNVAKKMGGG